MKTENTYNILKLSCYHNEFKQILAFEKDSDMDE